MTDNEKRAHDFALMIAYSMMKPSDFSGLEGDKSARELSEKPYKNYLDVYGYTLKRLKKDFGEQ